MSDVGPSERAPGDSALRPLAGGKLLSEITNRIVSLMCEHHARGPIKATTYVPDNLIVCMLSDGFTAIERTMIEGGEAQRVLEMRRDFQRMMKVRYSRMVEELTGREVLALLSQAHVDPDLTVEMFLMAGPLAGFGALEFVDPGRASTWQSAPLATADPAEGWCETAPAACRGIRATRRWRVCITVRGTHRTV
jgi:uncharacterized protein YbcI